MNSFKCPQCNLTNWATAAECKRCKMVFQANAAASQSFQNGDPRFNEPGYYQTPGYETQSGWQPDSQYQQNAYSQNYGYQDYRQPNFQGNPHLRGHMQSGQKSGLAIASMVLGILGLATSIFLIGLLFAPIGLILGITAIVKANKKPDIYGGKGFAIAGVVLSSLGVLLIPMIAAIAIPNLMAARRAANEGSAISSLRTLGSAEQTLIGTSNKCGDLPKLGSSQLIDPVLAAGEKNGYRFKVIVSPAANVCEIQATPADSSAGNRSFYLSTQDGIIRAANKKGLPADKNDLPIQ